jgi:nicotinamidase/pyrazinamidase
VRALLLVDVQNDFMPWGSLPVADGDAVVAVANAAAPRFPLVVASQDWHPPNHGSFASNHRGASPGDTIELLGERQVLWPDHCVQNSPGASFHSGLDVSLIDAVVRKGTDPGIDSYSAFFDNAHKRDTGLRALLAGRGVDEVFLVGLATDYCVRWSALDARRLGLQVAVVVDGVRGVELAPGDVARAIEEMRDAGCRIVTAAEAR